MGYIAGEDRNQIKEKTRGRFVCHIIRIYIYLIESPPVVKRISLL